MHEEVCAIAAIREQAEGFVFFQEHWDDMTQFPRVLNGEPRRTWGDYVFARNALDRVAAVSYDSSFDNSDWYAVPLPLTQLPSDTLATLAQFPNLEWLDFRYTRLTDEQLAQMPVNLELETLRLAQCPCLTSRGLTSLVRFRRLKNLDLSSNTIVDADLAVLAPLQSLERLDLSSNNITDAGLPHLYRLKHLRHLELGGTHVTRIGVYQLRKRLRKAQLITPYQEE